MNGNEDKFLEIILKKIENIRYKNINKGVIYKNLLKKPFKSNTYIF